MADYDHGDAPADGATADGAPAPRPDFRVDPPAAPLPLAYAAAPVPVRTVTIAHCGSAAEAEMVVGYLAGAGITAHAVDQNTAETIGVYLGGRNVRVLVLEADAERAAAALRQHDSDELEPADDQPTTGAADEADRTGADDDAGRSSADALVVVAAFDSPRLLREAATTLAAARVDAVLPRLVPRGGRSPGTGKRFLLRVHPDDLDRANDVLARADDDTDDEDADEPRCPKCRSWRVHPTGRGLLRGLALLFGAARRPDDGPGFECLSCKFRGPAAEFLPDERDR